MQNRKLLPPAPPFVDRTDPRVMAWELEEHAKAIEHLHTTKLEVPSSFALPLIGQGLLWVFGLALLGSPEKAGQFVKLFFP